MNSEQQQQKPQQTTPKKQLIMTPKKSNSEQDYQIIGTIGKGAYGRVSLVKRNNKLFAMKQIQKKKLAKQGKQYQAFVQKQLLRKFNHPGIIKLVKCFQDSKNLNFVMEYCHGGDFTTFMRFNYKHFNQKIRRFYVAQIVNILEYLHGIGITHRDLKPQNIMLSKDGHVKLIDFGTAEISKCTILDQKFNDDIQKQKKAVSSKKPLYEQQPQPVQQQQESPRKRRSTFVGTSFYLSPQLLQQNVCEPPSDLWALGCVIYQLYYMSPPFKAASEYQIFQMIKNVQVHFPQNESINEEAIDLIKKLLVKIPEDRLGANQKQGLMFSDLKNHPYFKDIQWDTLFTKKIPELNEEEYRKQEQNYKLKNIGREIQGDHQQYIQDQDQIIFSGMVQKKTFACFSPVYFILKNGPILYKLTNHSLEQLKVSLSEINQKGDVAEKIDQNSFKIIGDQCDYTIRTIQSDIWVDVLNREYAKQKSKE